MFARSVAALAVLALVAPAALAQTGPAPGTAQPSSRYALEGIAAIVNDKPISYSDVRQRARMLLMGLGGTQPTQEQVQQITGQALEQLINERLQLQRAEKFELEIEPEAITDAIENMAKQAGTTPDGLKSELARAGVNPESLEDQMRAEIAWSRLMGGMYGSRIRVSDNQVNDQLDRMRSSIKKTQFRVSEIFLYAPDPETKTQAETAAASIVSQLNQGADFRMAAQRLSSAPTSAAGGDMGWVTPEELTPEVAAAVSKAAGPGLLPPIPVQNGVYLITVTNKREPSQLTTKVDLKRIITSDASDTNLKTAIGRIKSCADVSTVTNTIAGLRATDLKDIKVEDLGEEGRDMVMKTDIGKPTDIFAAGGGLAVMYVCARTDGAEALPSRDDLKGSLRSKELDMISERELRNLRRDATVIYR